MTIIAMLAVIALVISYRVEILQPIISHIAKSAGVELTRLEGLELKSSIISVSSLEGEYQSRQYLNKFLLQNLSANYLIESGRPKIRNVNIDHAKIFVSKSSITEESATDSKFEIPEINVENLNLVLPFWDLPELNFKNVTLEAANDVRLHAQVHEYPFTNFQEYLGSKNFTAADGQINGDVSLIQKNDGANPKMQFSANLRSNNLSGGALGYPFSNLELVVKIEYYGRLHVDSEASLSKFSGPIVASKVNLRAELDDGSLHISGGFDAFGGRIELPKIISEGNSLKPFKLIASGVSLAEVLRLYAPEGYDATGQFDCDAVITAATPFPTIFGSFESSAPGQLRIAADKLPLPAQGQTDLVRRALSDFRFTKIKGSLNSSADGAFELKAAIDGSSPLVDNGRMIHLNLSLQENLPQLIESLRLISQLPQALQQKEYLEH